MPHVVLAVFLLLAVLVPQPRAEEKEDSGPMSAKTFQGLELRSLGPAFMSGRIADIAIHPLRSSTWYVAVGSGGVWKTTNAGTTWKAVFDGQESYSIGCLTLDPNNPETVWVGTGENVGGRHVGCGDGVYRSMDGGATWKNVGLKESEHIGNIVVDPRDSRVVYVAAQGPLWSGGGERGLFKTTDSGDSWTKILGGGEHTGVNEVRADPRNPDVLYASTHERLRTVAALINGGPESGIHKSTDGGATWRELTNGLPGGAGSEEKESEMGKIGLALSPQDPDVVYAVVEQAHRRGGFYRSSDAGESWERRSDYESSGTGPHYYQEIFASPHRFDRVYRLDVRIDVTEDGGSTFRRVEHESKHSDNHAMAFVPHDPDYLIVGCDGGIYESWDLGRHWKFVANLPVTQFYKVAVDNDEPFYNLYGGTQDNNTQGGPSRTDNVHGIRNSDWFVTLFGDGHQPAVDPTNPDIVYSEWQRGNLVRHDRKTGQITHIQPQPGMGEPTERFNWDSPILISPHDPARLYFASQRVWRSDDRGDSWVAVSEDLTRGLDRLGLPMMDRVQSYDGLWDVRAMSVFGTVTSISESPLEEGLLWAGTDDGLIHVSENGGGSWRQAARPPGVKDFFFVNDVKADLRDPDAAYVCADHHKMGDFRPYVWKTTDLGRSWKSIASDLPERHIVWRIVQDHVRPELLFLGTELGLFFTPNGGDRWVELQGGLPTIPVRDLVIQRRENDLVCATFGRGIFILDDYGPLREASDSALAEEARLYPVPDAWWYLPRMTLSFRKKASQGDAFFVAPNPPFGAVFTYYLRDEIPSRRESRRKRERSEAEAGADSPFPGWDEIRREELEEEPAILLTVRDLGGRVVRRVTGPVTAGFHRVSWDLRFPSPKSWKPEAPADGWEEFERGALAPPGLYTVAMAKRVEGVVTELAPPVEFEVRPLRDGGTLPGASFEELAAFHGELDAHRRDFNSARSALETTIVRATAIREALMQSTAPGTLHDEVHVLERRLHALQDRLLGPRSRWVAQDEGPVAVEERLDAVLLGNLFSTQGPTTTHLQSLEIAGEELGRIAGELDGILRAELPALEKGLDEARVPWTPGRAVR